MFMNLYSYFQPLISYVHMPVFTYMYTYDSVPFLMLPYFIQTNIYMYAFVTVYPFYTTLFNVNDSK